MDSARWPIDPPGMGEGDPGEITMLLGRMRDRAGADAARDALMTLVYRDLEAIASAYTRRPDVSLEPRGLVHELYERLARAGIDARDRKHFFAVAALAMRQILIDRARRRKAARRGGDAQRVTLTGLPGSDAEFALVEIEDALCKLEALAPRQARIVELRCLVGLSVAETAEVLGVSERTVHGDWRMARAWLIQALRAGAPGA